MKTLILAYIFLTAQATANSFTTFIAEFNAETGANYTGSVKFGSTKTFESAVAILDVSTPYNSPIYINQKLWQTYSYNERRWLMYHELSHAAFGMAHYNTTLSDGCAEHYMYFETMKGSCIRRHEQRYLKQLRNMKSIKGTGLDIYVDMKVKGK